MRGKRKTPVAPPTIIHTCLTIHFYHITRNYIIYSYCSGMTRMLIYVISLSCTVSDYIGSGTCIVLRASRSGGVETDISFPVS